MIEGTKLRGRRLVVVIVAICVLVYATVVALYAVNAASTIVVGCQDAAPDDAIRLSLDPQSVDAVANRLTVTLDVDSFGPVADPETKLAADDLTLVVTGTDGERTIDIPAASITSPVSLRLLTSGAVEGWPFDAHAAQTAIAAITGEGSAARDVPVVVCGSVHVPGWTFSSREVPGDAALVIDGTPVTKIEITAQRSAATIAFGIVILCLMVVLPILGLTVAIRVFRGTKKVEATLMSWIAAMLFATLPLRGFLPGAPPIGSWVDYLVVLWVVAGLIASLVVYALAWRRWAPDGERP